MARVHEAQEVVRSVPAAHERVPALRGRGSAGRSTADAWPASSQGKQVNRGQGGIPVRASGPRDGSPLPGADGISGRPLPRASLQHAPPTTLLPCLHRRPNEARATGRSLTIGYPLLRAPRTQPLARAVVHDPGCLPQRWHRLDSHVERWTTTLPSDASTRHRCPTSHDDSTRAVPMPCVQMPSLEAIAAPEAAVDLPVLTASTATSRQVLSTLGAHAPVPQIRCTVPRFRFGDSLPQRPCARPGHR